MKKRILVFFIIILIGFAVGGEIRAGAADNVYGWAWAGVPQAVAPEKLGLGWISFNSENCVSNPGGLTDQSQCSGGPGNYGVDIDSSTGEFSGYAYFDMNDPNTGVNEIGWIDFAPAGLYPTCPGTTCPDGSPDYSVCLDLPGVGQVCDGAGDWTVTGWARALNYDGGWDGWILLGPIIKGGTDYGVYIDSSTGEFHGWAWGSDVVGWISFNCSNSGPCATVDYKVMTDLVINSPPYVEPGSADFQVFPPDYCVPNPAILLQWTYRDNEGDQQAQYNLQVATDSGFSNLVVDAVVNQSIAPAGTGTSSVEVVESPTPPTTDRDIGYTGTTYYWQVGVMAATGSPEWSDFVEGPSFQTPAAPYPEPDFTWSPSKPEIEETIQFTDLSTCTAGCSSWAWDFDNDGTSDSIDPNPTHSYSDSGPHTIGLTVTDANGSCSITHDIKVRLPLPSWREIPPTF